MYLYKNHFSSKPYNDIEIVLNTTQGNKVHLLHTCMQLKRTKCGSLLFFTTARKSRKKTTSGANWLL